jgi:hypothetical protein
MNISDMTAHENIEVHATIGDAKRRVSELSARDHDDDLAQWAYDSREVKTRSSLILKVSADNAEFV